MKTCDVMMSINTQVRTHFTVYLLNCKSFGHESGPEHREGHSTKNEVFHKGFLP